MLTEANGLLYMRARYYSPDLMRFINEDIVTGDISNSNTLNRYSYVEGNPVTMVDPFGLEAERSGWQKVTDWFTKNYHEVLDVLGFVPGYGDYIDFCNGMAYAKEGDWVNASLSYISMIPILGDIVGKGGKAVCKGIKAISKTDDLVDIASFLGKYADEAIEVVTKYSDDAIEVARDLARTSPDSFYKYKDLKKLISEAGLSGAGEGLEAHHLLEKKFASLFGVEADDIISVALTPEWHRGVDGEKLIGAGANIDALIDEELMKLVGTNSKRLLKDLSSAEDVWKATKKVYESLKHEDWAEAVYEAYVKIKGIQY